MWWPAGVIVSLGFWPLAATAGDTLGPDTGIAWDLTPAQITSTCRDALTQARVHIHEIDARVGSPVSFAGLAAIEEVSADLTERLIAPTQLMLIAPDKAVRDAASQCSDEYAAFGVELSSDTAVYALAKAATATAVTPEESQLAKIYLENGRRAGAGLDSATRARVTSLLKAINTLQIAYARALAEDTPTIRLTPEERSGLPAALNSAERDDGHGVVISVNESTIGPFLENEISGAARRRFLTAYDRRGGAANVKRMADTVALRQQVARLLGYSDWATYQLDVKMAKTPARAQALVMQVHRELLPRALTELKVLEDLKRASGDTSPLQRWDYYYYEHQLEKARYDVDDEQVREYFPVDKALPAMLDLYAHLLGVRFELLQPVIAWAPQVIEYAIYDSASSEPLGWFFLDLYPRTGKFEHFMSAGLRSGRNLADGGYRLPVASIIGNWPLPETGKPSLLSHDDLVTFFHEFGHVMHATLSRTRFASLYGPNTRLDFIEAPSQMLENWMWQPAVLKRISSRVGSGEPLPDELIQRIIALRHVADGMYYVRQAFLARFDLKLHTGSGKTDPDVLWFSLWRQMVPLTPISNTYPAAAFGHLMGGGYDAGYYGYLWSRVFAQDMFSVFQGNGLDSTAVGSRYRQEILVPGGAVEPDILLHRFLGRDVSFLPFYEDLGITRR